jgi:hypothetical protein
MAASKWVRSAVAAKVSGPESHASPITRIVGGRFVDRSGRRRNIENIENAVSKPHLHPSLRAKS